MKRLFAWLRVTVFFAAAFVGMEYLIDSGDSMAIVKYPVMSLVLAVYLLLLIAFEMVLAAVRSLKFMLLPESERQKQLQIDTLPLMQKPGVKRLLKKLTRSHPMEHEAELLLHHDYDGIRELDNQLPPWWVYSFYITIFFAAVYLVRFEVMGGDDQETELRKELAEAKAAVEEWKKTAPDQLTEDKVTLLTDAAELAKGKTLFESNCAACHRADGGGQIGPNLTDEYWILGGGIKNVFHTISNGGRDGKGMIAWNSTLKPTEIQRVASYVLSLQGSNPKDAKAPDGEIWADGQKSDSSAVAKPLAMLEKK